MRGATIRMIWRKQAKQSNSRSPSPAREYDGEGEGWLCRGKGAAGNTRNPLSYCHAAIIIIIKPPAATDTDTGYHRRAPSKAYRAAHFWVIFAVSLGKFIPFQRHCVPVRPLLASTAFYRINRSVYIFFSSIPDHQANP